MLAVPDFAVPVLYGVGVFVTFTLFRVLSPGWGLWPDFARKSVQALLWLASVALLWTLPDAFRDSPEDPVTFGVKCLGALGLLEALYQTATRKSLANRNARPVREGKGEYRPGAPSKASPDALFTPRKAAGTPATAPASKEQQMSIWAFLSEPEKDPDELVTVTQIVLRPPKVSPMVNPLRARQSAEPSALAESFSKASNAHSRKTVPAARNVVAQDHAHQEHPEPFKWTPPASLRLRPRVKAASGAPAEATGRGPAHLRAKSKELKSLKDLPGFLHQVDPRYKELGAISQVQLPGETAAPEARKAFMPHIAPTKASLTTAPPAKVPQAAHASAQPIPPAAEPIAVPAKPALKARFLGALKVNVPLPSLVALVKSAAFGVKAAAVASKAAEPLEVPPKKDKEGASRKRRRSSRGEGTPAASVVPASSLPGSSATAEPARRSDDKRTARSRRRSRA